MFCCLFGLFHEGVFVPVGFAVEAEDPAVVDDAVDDRGGHVPVAEHVAPSAGLEVRGGDDAAGLVAVRAAAAVWIRPGSRSPSRTGWPGSRAGRAWRPPGPSRARRASTAGCAPRPMTCSGVALSRTRPPRCRGFCWLIRPPSCICRNASNPARLRFPHPRGCVWHMCRSPRGRRSVPR